MLQNVSWHSESQSLKTEIQWSDAIHGLGVKASFHELRDRVHRPSPVAFSFR